MIHEGTVFLATDVAPGPLDTTFNPNWLGLLIGVILPVLVGLVTKQVTSSGVKATLLLLFSAANGLLTEFANAQATNVSYNWTTALFTWGGSFALGVAMHFGFYQPRGVTAWAQRTLVR